MPALIRLAIVALFASLIPSLVHASARERMEAFTRGLQGLEGRFVQRVFDANGRLSEESSGTVALKQPRQFRWEYVKPFPQLIVADGDHIWIHDPDLEQVTVRNQSYEEQVSPLAVLIDPGELDRQFKVSEGGSTDGTDWLALAPKKDGDAQFTAARLGFGPDGLREMRIEDSLGQRTEISFTDWRRNPAFAAGQFRFVPPPGTDVVGEVDEGATVFPVGG